MKDESIIGFASFFKGETYYLSMKAAGRTHNAGESIRYYVVIPVGVLLHIDSSVTHMFCLRY